MCFTAPTALSGAFSQRRRRLGKKQKLWICFDFCTQDRRKFNTLLRNCRSVRHICCLSNTDEKIFCAPHAPQTLRTALFTLKSRHFRITATFWRRHISPRFEACRKQQRALPPYRLTFRFTHCPARSRLRLPRRRIPQTRTRRLVAAVARVFLEETSNVIKTIYPFILSLNCNIKYHYSAIPERQRPLAPTAASRRRIATMYRVLSPWSSYDRSLSASAYHNFTSTYATYRRGNPRILSIALTTPCAWLII